MSPPEPLPVSSQSGRVSSAGRLPNLDLLRLFAILFIFGTHATPHGLVPPAEPQWVQHLLFVFQNGGWMAVDLFFVLSGFLVSGLLFTEYQKHGTISPARFYLRRGLKIYPAYYVFLAASVIILPAAWRPPTLVPWIDEALFLQNYLPRLWLHTWSLAVEEHFYLLLPLLFVLSMRWRRDHEAPLRPILVVALASPVVLFWLRLWSVAQSPSSTLYYTATHLRLDTLMAGVALSYVHHFHGAFLRETVRAWCWPMLAVGAAGMAVMSVWPRATLFPQPQLFSGMQVAGVMVVAAALLLPQVGGSVLRACAWVGAQSYSIYLWHYAIIEHLTPFILRRTGPIPTLLLMAMLLLPVLAIGIFMAVIIEMPVLALRNRWFPSRSGSAA